MNQPTANTRPTHTAQRRGTIIVLALAILAVLALAGVSYVTVVRVERNSANAFENELDFERQAQVANAAILDVIGADLFGNKIVPPTLPRTINGEPVWPTMFEDREFQDLPSLDEEWWSDSARDDTLKTFANRLELSPFQPNPTERIAPQDDAWLASTEPEWRGTGDNPFPTSITDVANNTDTHRFLTNLRSAYRWSNRERVWLRDDGQFLDLAGFFLQTLDGRPYADCESLADPTLDAQAGHDQQVFDLQMSELSAFAQTNPGYSGPAQPDEFTPLDERFFADTDGDLRPDARWQTIDALGNRFGLVWVIATRVTDASGLANVNTAIEFPSSFVGPTFTATPNGDGNDNWLGWHIGTGATPADIDLFRLLTYDYAKLNATVFDPLVPNLNGSSFEINGYDPQVDLISGRRSIAIASRTPFQSHLELTIAHPGLISTLQTGATAPADPRLGDATDPALAALVNRHAYNPEANEFSGDTWATSATGAFPLTRQQRASVYERVTSAFPDNPPGLLATGYSIREEANLRSFGSTPSGLYTQQLEQNLDGPEQSGYLAGGTPFPPDTEVGPLRSGVDPAIARSFDPAAPQGRRPSTSDIFTDIRRQLTTASGIADFSPVPAVNPNGFQSTFFRRKVRFADLANNLTPDLAQRTLEAFMWALAPQAVEDYLYPGLFDDSAGITTYTQLESQLTDTADIFYGGGANGEAQRFRESIANIPGVTPPAQIKANFALWRSLALTANLIDANDGDSLPTALRFHPVDAFGVGNQIRPADTIETELNRRFAHGDIDDDALDIAYVGAPGNGVSFYGLDRQPFLREVYTTALYQSNTTDPRGDTTVTIDPTDGTGNDYVGSIIAVELANPWPSEIALEPFAVNLQTEWDNVTVSAPTIQINFAGSGAVLPPNSSRVYYWHSTIDLPAVATDRFGDIFEQYVNAWVNELDVPSAAVRLPGVGFGDPTTLADVELGSSLRIDYGDGLGNTSTSELDGDKLIPFQNPVFRDEPIAALLIVRSGINSQGSIVVDRLTRDGERPYDTSPTGTVNFPGATADTFTVQFRDEPALTAAGFSIGCITRLRTEFGEPTLSSTRGNFRVATHGRLARPSNPNPNTRGLPQYILEDGARNHIEEVIPISPGNYNTAESENYFQVWDSVNTAEIAADCATTILAGPDGDLNIDEIRVGPPIDPDVMIAPARLAGYTLTLDDKLGTTPWSTTDIPPFQLFVPNRTLDTVADIHLISTIANVHIHRSDIAADIHTATAAEGAETFSDGAWITVAEQFARVENRFADHTSATPPAARLNPYFAKLNPFRYIPQGGNAMDTATVPEPTPDMTLPPAIKIFDCFEAIDHPGNRAAGRINLNTMTRRVASLLPFTHPLNTISELGDTDMNASTLTPSSSFAIGRRNNYLIAWRDRLDAGPALGFGDFSDAGNYERVTGLDGLRLLSTDQLGPDADRGGFITAGEIAILGEHDDSGFAAEIPTDNATNQTFLALGADGAGIEGLPFELYTNNNPPQAINPDTGTLFSSVNTSYADEAYNPVDDAEERLALFRALSNIVSSRSDVFIVTYVLRGYDPDQIESIDLAAYPDPIEAMNDPLFTPRYETRRLLVVDRSNMTRPTDRPRILYETELPSTSP